MTVKELIDELKRVSSGYVGGDYLPVRIDDGTSREYEISTLDDYDDEGKHRIYIICGKEIT